jgi:hypothetical protein
MREEKRMGTEVSLDAVYVPSEEIVAREIEGEIVIVPLGSGIGNMEEELYTLSETARAVWEKMDGARTLRAIAEELVREYEAPPGTIEEDVAGLLEELVKRKIAVRKG